MLLNVDHIPWFSSQNLSSEETLSTDLPWGRVHMDWKDETVRIAFFVVRYI